MLNMESVLKYPVATEKAIRLIEGANIVTFIVGLDSNKSKIKEAFEDRFDSKVKKINTLVTTNNEKKAYIELEPEYPALDIATQLGLI